MKAKKQNIIKTQKPKSLKKFKLIYPKSLLIKLLRKNKVADKISNESIIILSKILEFITEEIFFLILKNSESKKIKRINIPLIKLAFKEDSDLRQFFGGRNLDFRNSNLEKEDLEVVVEEEIDEEHSQKDFEDES